MKKQVLLEVICAILALVFIYAGISKLLDYNTFSIQLRKSPLLVNYADIIAWAMPVAEIAIAVMLFIGDLRLFALYAYSFLMFSFTIYLLLILNFSYYIPCSCGGILQNMSWQAHIVFNTFLIAINIYAVIMESKNHKPVTMLPGEL